MRKIRQDRERGRTSALLLILAVVMGMVIAACADSGADPTTTAGGEESTTSAAEEPTTTAGGDTTTTAAAEPLVVACDTTVPSDAPGAMTMWERSGGNGQMVDALVCAWNDRNPDRPINLEYIEHTDMVSRLARGLATGDVPDLMGMDLIYGPQFTSTDQLLEVTGHGRRGPHGDGQPGPPRRCHLGGRASTGFPSTPTSRPCSGTRTCSKPPGSTRRCPRPT